MPFAEAALESRDVVVVYNSAISGSKKVALHYQDKRNIPDENMCYVFASTNEYITRKEFENTIRDPLRIFLLKHPRKDDLRALTLIYGMPLGIWNDPERPPQNSASVDSELSLVLVRDFPLEHWLINP